MHKQEFKKLQASSLHTHLEQYTQLWLTQIPSEGLEGMTVFFAGCQHKHIEGGGGIKKNFVLWRFSVALPEC